MKNLLDAKENEKVRVIKVTAGKDLERRLAELGISFGTELQVMKSNGSGPIIIKVKDTRLGLGRGMAVKILVDTIQGGESDE